MNPRERVLTAIKGGTPDTVPLAEMHIDPEVMQKIYPGISKLDFYKRFDIDGIQCNYDLYYEDISQYIMCDSFGV